MELIIAKKLISIVIVAIFVLSAMVSPTLAWRDFSQHGTNEFTGLNLTEQEEQEKTFADLTLTKTVEILEGANLAEAEEEGEESDESEELDSPDELGEGEDLFTEESGNEGADEAPEKIVIEDSMVPLADTPPVPPDDTFEFTITFKGVPDGPITIFFDGEPREMEVLDGKLVIELKNGQTAIIKDLPVGAEYMVVETPMEDYVIESENAGGLIPEGGITVTFTNYYGPEGFDPVEPEEKPEPPNPPKPPRPKPSIQAPPSPTGEAYRPVTGDESNVWLWVFVMIGAAFGLKHLTRRRS